jgi:hypothetical protein
MGGRLRGFQPYGAMASGFELNDIRFGFPAPFKGFVILLKDHGELQPCPGYGQKVRA